MIGRTTAQVSRDELDELVGKVRKIDTDEVRRQLDEAEATERRAAKAGAAPGK